MKSAPVVPLAREVVDRTREVLPILFASECPPCTLCGEPWCVECEEHYADCAHPGPDSEIEHDEASGAG